MNLQFTSAVFTAMLIIASSSNCAGLQGISTKQTGSGNFALADGVTSNDPAIIDGDIGTIGQSQYVESDKKKIIDLRPNRTAYTSSVKLEYGVPRTLRNSVATTFNIYADGGFSATR